MTVSLVQNFFKQTVTTPWTTGVGNFYVSQKPNVTSGFLVISPNSESLREIVAFSAVGTDGGGDYVTVSARGLGGTTEQAHGAGEKVYMNITAQHIEQIKQAIEDINNAGALNASTTVKGVARLTASPNTVIGTPTITIASPAVVTLTAHGLTENDEIQFTTTGNLPTGIIPSAKYYVIGTGLTANEFQFSETFGGPAVNTSGSQSGVHTLTRVTPRAVSDTDPRIPSADIAAALAGTNLAPSATNKFLTEKTLYTEEDQSQTTQNATTQVGQADSTGNRNKIHQSFIPTFNKIRGVKLYKEANTGTFTGTITVNLVADNSGNPDTTVLATATITNANWNAAPVGEALFLFATEYESLVVGNTYWITITTSTADNSNYPNLGTNSAGGYANGVAKYSNTTDGFVSQAFDLYFKTLNGLNDLIVNQITDVFTTGGTWYKPEKAKFVFVQVWGAGASGGRFATSGAGGGGGGGYDEMWFPASILGATETVTVGAGGAAQTVGGNGNAGGSSSFGSWVAAFGGGAGVGNGGGGGGGGSKFGAGSAGSGSTGGAGGSSTGTYGTGGAAEAGGASGYPFYDVGGGGGGGAASSGTPAGGSSYKGGGGGGGGNSDGTGSGSGVGGNSVYGGGGGGGSSTSGGVKSGGTSVFGGNGGASAQSGNAQAGTAPAGGGGAAFAGNSGAGARGEVRVTTFF